MPTEQAYRDYVAGNLDRLRRTAYLLCGDWHLADDLTSTVLVKLLRHWRRAAVMEHRDAYVRRMLMSAWLDERRRPWRRESSTDRLPDRPAATADADQRLDVLSLLAGLPPRRRAVLVLRYFCDLSVEETAQALGCSEGTVKSQAARALESLRAGLKEGDPLWI
ncbi:SigE family RNA polymerase sigma factor [Dactylosporangium sp. NBC_01737]|uniref:SigE family RNA polymerase sigma factor n=1 Tax=Dactylosporangium sp. NBC_01737 TaxID=2975959 RepID=UPI002E131003|nr:SigE family RNA polymerase sigma factor [Dactylosporangium sp. NBC_01737]